MDDLPPGKAAGDPRGRDGGCGPGARRDRPDRRCSAGSRGWWGLRSGAGALSGRGSPGRDSLPEQAGGSSRRGGEGAPLPRAAVPPPAGAPRGVGRGRERGAGPPAPGVAPPPPRAPRPLSPALPRQSPHLAALLKYAADTSSPKVDRA